MLVSLRIPREVTRRIARIAEAKGTSVQVLMLEAIREKLEAEEAQAPFRADAQRRLARMKKAGKGIPAEEVFDFLIARARGQNVERPKARKR